MNLFIEQLGEMKRAGVPPEFRVLAYQMAMDAQKAGEPAKVAIIFNERDLTEHPRIQR